MEEYNQIEQYVNGLLKGEEKKAFEKSLKNDPDLRKEVRLHRVAINAIEMNEDFEFKEHLQALDKKIIDKKRRQQTIRFFAAAAILFAVIASIFLLQNDKTPEQLYAIYFDHYPADINLRNNQNLSDVDKALNTYNNKKYQNAILFFDALPSEQINNVTLLSKGIALLETKQFDSAIEVFSKVTLDKNDPLSGVADWYLGLTFLKKQDLAKAKSQFEKSINNNTFNNKQAKEILKELE